MAKLRSTWQPYKTDKSERLMQLTSALLFAERGLTKRELYYSITDYRADVAAKKSDDSLNRKFERDKSDLRSSGILVQVSNPLDAPEEQRYVISSDSFVWPTKTTLSPHQLQLLNLASQAWSMASFSSEVNQGLIKLRSLGLEPAEADLLGLAPKFKTHEPSFMPLNKAVDERYEVTFNYRRQDGEVKARRVRPWQLQNISGQWLLVCFDVDQNEVRNFLLKRIVSKVSAVEIGQELVTFDAPSADELQAAIDDLAAHTAKQVATIKVRKDSSAWFHFHLDENQDAEVSFEYMDLHLLAEELSVFALDIKVVSPRELDEAIRAGFEKVASDHA